MVPWLQMGKKKVKKKGEIKMKTSMKKLLICTFILAGSLLALSVSECSAAVVWEPVEAISGEIGVVRITATSDALYALGESGWVYKRNESDSSWTAISGGHTAIAATSDTMYVRDSNRMVYKYNDTDGTFTYINGAGLDIAATSDALYLQSDYGSGVYRYDGSNWSSWGGNYVAQIAATSDALYLLTWGFWGGISDKYDESLGRWTDPTPSPLLAASVPNGSVTASLAATVSTIVSTSIYTYALMTTGEVIRQTPIEESEAYAAGWNDLLAKLPPGIRNALEKGLAKGKKTGF